MAFCALKISAPSRRTSVNCMADIKKSILECSSAIMGYCSVEISCSRFIVLLTGLLIAISEIFFDTMSSIKLNVAERKAKYAHTSSFVEKLYENK